MSTVVVAGEFSGHKSYPEEAMAASVALITLCATAAGFYVRFLLAMCREFRYVWICRILHLQPVPNEISVLEPRREPSDLRRAA